MTFKDFISLEILNKYARKSMLVVVKYSYQMYVFTLIYGVYILLVNKVTYKWS